MGIVVNKNQNDRSAIQARINADLRARLQSSSDDDLNDIEKSDVLKDSKKTGRFAWVWFVLILGAIVSVILMIMI